MSRWINARVSSPGGQQQRVTLARALVTRPEAVFLDEPTGALDTRTARQVLQTLRQTVNRTGQTALMVTHDPVAASFADSVVFLADGRLAGSMIAPSPADVAEHMTSLGDRAGPLPRCDRVWQGRAHRRPGRRVNSPCCGSSALPDARSTP